MRRSNPISPLPIVSWCFLRYFNMHAELIDRHDGSAAWSAPPPAMSMVRAMPYRQCLQARGRCGHRPWLWPVESTSIDAFWRLCFDMHFLVCLTTCARAISDYLTGALALTASSAPPPVVRAYLNGTHPQRRTRQSADPGQQVYRLPDRPVRPSSVQDEQQSLLGRMEHARREREQDQRVSVESV